MPQLFQLNGIFYQNNRGMNTPQIIYFIRYEIEKTFSALIDSGILWM